MKNTGEGYEFVEKDYPNVQGTMEPIFEGNPLFHGDRGQIAGFRNRNPLNGEPYGRIFSQKEVAEEFGKQGK